MEKREDKVDRMLYLGKGSLQFEVRESDKLLLLSMLLALFESSVAVVELVLSPAELGPSQRHRSSLIVTLSL